MNLEQRPIKRANDVVRENDETVMEFSSLLCQIKKIAFRSLGCRVKSGYNELPSGTFSPTFCQLRTGTLVMAVLVLVVPLCLNVISVPVANY